jgi:hypothetical protein
MALAQKGSIWLRIVYIGLIDGCTHPGKGSSSIKSMA